MNQEFLQQLEESCKEVIDSLNHLPRLAETYDNDPNPTDVLADLLKHVPLIGDEQGHWNYALFQDDGKVLYILAEYICREQRSKHAITMHWLAHGLRAMAVNLEMHATLLEGNTRLGYEFDESDEG